MQRPESGNTLVEYAFITALIAMVAIGALAMLGGNLDGLLRGNSSALGNKSGTIALLQGNAKPPTGSTSVPGGNTAVAANVAPISGTKIQVNGKSITLPANHSATVETAGGNGSEETLAFTSKLTSLAAELEKEGADPGLVDMLSQLANTGHTLANTQHAVEALCPTGTGYFTSIASTVINSSDPTPALIDLNGDGLIDGADTAVKTQQDFAKFENSLSEIVANSGTFQQKLTTLQNYIAAHPGAYPPELEAYVSEQSQKIVTIASKYQKKETTSYMDLGPVGGSLQQGSINLGDGITSKNGSEQTQGSSNNVCASGGTNCTQGGFPTTSTGGG